MRILQKKIKPAKHCVICDQETDEYGRCFDCFRKYTWIVSRTEGDGKTTYYGDPPKRPEDAETCSCCNKYTQFFHLEPLIMQKLPKRWSVPHLCYTCNTIYYALLNNNQIKLLKKFIKAKGTIK